MGLPNRHRGAKGGKKMMHPKREMRFKNTSNSLPTATTVSAPQGQKPPEEAEDETSPPSETEENNDPEDLPEEKSEKVTDKKNEKDSHAEGYCKSDLEETCKSLGEDDMKKCTLESGCVVSEGQCEPRLNDCALRQEEKCEQTDDCKWIPGTDSSEKKPEANMLQGISNLLGGVLGSAAEEKKSDNLPKTIPKGRRAIPGADKVGSGFDVVTGLLTLPLFERDRWQENSISMPYLNGFSVPFDVSVSAGESGERNFGPQTYTNVEEYTRKVASEYGLGNTPGAFVMSREAKNIRESGLHVDLTDYGNEYVLYTLTQTPSTVEHTEKNGENLSSQLTEAFVEAVEKLPDCYMVDCVIRNDLDFSVGTKGCVDTSSRNIFFPNPTSLFAGEDTKLPTCEEWATSKLEFETDDDSSVKEEEGTAKVHPKCSSKYFRDLPLQYFTKSAKSFKYPCDSEDEEDGCIEFGEDKGTICNLSDIFRLGKFFDAWGNYIVTEASFGGLMNVRVKTRKDSQWPKAVLGQEFGFGSQHTFPTLDAMQPYEERWANPSFPLSFPYNDTSIAISTTDLRRGDSVNEQYKEVGIQSVEYEFLGGLAIPVPTQRIRAADVATWIDSIRDMPAMLPHSVKLQPIEKTFDHPTFAIRGNKLDEAEKSEYHKMLKRKQVLVQNFRLFWLSKASKLGNIHRDLGLSKAKKRFQMQRLHGSVLDYARKNDEIEAEGFHEGIEHSNELSELLADHVIEFQHAMDRYVSTCRQVCTLEYNVDHLSALMYGKGSIPEAWKTFPPPTSLYENDGVEAMMSSLKKSLEDCNDDCTKDITIMRLSHEPAAFGGDERRKQSITKFFATAKVNCDICRGLLFNLADSALTRNGRGVIDSVDYCNNLNWASWTNPDLQMRHFDVTKPHSFFDNNRLNEGAPDDSSYPTQFCIGLDRHLSMKMNAELRENGLIFNPVRKPTLYQALQSFMLYRQKSPRDLSGQICSEFVGCSIEGKTPLEKQIHLLQIDLEKKKKSKEMEENSLLRLEKIMKDKSKDLSTQVVKSIEKSVEKLQENLKGVAKEEAETEKSLKKLQTERQAELKEEKMAEENCLFECYKDTKWGLKFRQERGQIGINDPIPVSQLAAMKSTQICGYPVLLERKKCGECAKLKCLVAARMKCYAWKCKSPYVSTGGTAFFVPKTVII
eukprot:g99.t1